MRLFLVMIEMWLDSVLDGAGSHWSDGGLVVVVVVVAAADVVVQQWFGLHTCIIIIIVIKHVVFTSVNCQKGQVRQPENRNDSCTFKPGLKWWSPARICEVFVVQDGIMLFPRGGWARMALQQGVSSPDVPWLRWPGLLQHPKTWLPWELEPFASQQELKQAAGVRDF